MAEYTYSRNLSDGEWDLDTRSLAESVKTALIGEVFALRASYSTAVFTFVNTLSTVDEATLDASVAAHRAANPGLAAAKSNCFVQIDTRTDSLIDQGFVYLGETLSLSADARQTIISMDLQRDDVSIIYPIVWNSLDNLTSVSVVDSASVHALALSAMSTVRAHVDSGTALKDLVRAATTVAMVKAVNDSR